MKNIYLLLFLFIAVVGNAQQTEPVKPQAAVTKAALPHPPPDYTRFPGGQAEFFKFFNKNFKQKKFKSKGTIKMYVSFTVQKDGSVSDVHAVNDPGNGIGKEAVRVIEMSPKWNPKIVDGEAIIESYSFPIVIFKNN